MNTPLSSSDLPVLDAFGALWQGAAAVTIWLKERHREPAQDGSGAGFWRG